jgi:hypothetical protein
MGKGRRWRSEEPIEERWEKAGLKNKSVEGTKEDG